MFVSVNGYESENGKEEKNTFFENLENFLEDLNHSERTLVLRRLDCKGRRALNYEIEV